MIISGAPGSTLAGPKDLTFDRDGPKLDGLKLTKKTPRGWQPTERDVLERELVNFATLFIPELLKRLDVVCRAMNLGDFATAAIAAEHLRRDLGRKRRPLAKASVDDPKHPGWPAGSPDGKGGRFRPKDGSASGGSLDAKDARIKRLIARRGLRSILRRILTFKRFTRLVAEIFGDAVPGLDAFSDLATLRDAVKIGAEAAADAADTEAAIAFVEKGPQALEDLQVGSEPENFTSFDAFKKSELEKRFGAAGAGYEYHHIVEQGPNAASFSAEDLQSTSNIIRIPRLLHEEINAYMSTPRMIDGERIALREYLRGKSYSDQYASGLRVLEYVGIIH